MNRNLPISPLFEAKWLSILLFAVLFVLGVSSMSGQSSKVDSIQRLVPPLSGKSLVDALNQVVSFGEDATDSIQLAHIIALADSIDYPEGLVKASQNMVFYHFDAFQYKKADRLNDFVIAEADRLGMDSVYCEAALFSSWFGIEFLDFEKAHKYAYLSYQKAISGKNEFGEVLGLSALAWFYRDIKHYPNGVHYAQKTLDLATKIGDEEMRLDAITALLHLYKEQKKYTAGIELYESHFKTDVQNKDYAHPATRIGLEIAVSHIFSLLKQPEKTLIHTDLAQKLNKSIEENPFNKCWINIEKAIAYKQLGNLDSMFLFISIADSTSLSIDFPSLNQKIAEVLSDYYSLEGDKTKQLKYQEKAKNISFQDKRNIALIDFFNSDYYRNEIIKSNSSRSLLGQNRLLYGLGIMMFLIFIVWYLRKRSNNSKTQTIEVVHENQKEEIVQENNESEIVEENNLVDTPPTIATNQKIDMIALERESESWSTFKVYFEQIRPGFLESLSIKHSNLTKNEQRLCCFYLLELTAKEIAQMLNVQTSSVSIAKYRLRKKLNFDSGRLEDYLISINHNQDT